MTSSSKIPEDSSSETPGSFLFHLSGVKVVRGDDEGLGVWEDRRYRKNTMKLRLYME